MSERFDPDKDAITAIMSDPDRPIVPSIRKTDGEERSKSVGMVDGKRYTAVFTWRGDIARYISVRRSDLCEERVYRSEG